MNHPKIYMTHDETPHLRSHCECIEKHMSDSEHRCGEFRMNEMANPIMVISHDGDVG